MSKYFSKALNNFISDVASGDAIRHLADKGFTVPEIVSHLSFPTPEEKVRSVVWKHYIETGVIRLTEPDNEPLTKITYVKEYNQYGKSSFRKVTETIDNDEKLQYVACDFGKAIYKDKEAFINSLDDLDKRDIEYVLSLPWPLETVWHVLDDRMQRIMETRG